jgi:hypothetical protein
MTDITGDRKGKSNFDPDLANRVNKEYEKSANAPILEQADRDFIHVPSVNLYFSRYLVNFEHNWLECHESLQKKGYRMPTIPEFIALLKHAKANDKELYEQITVSKDERNEEWLDAKFEEKEGVWRVYHTYKIEENQISYAVGYLEPFLINNSIDTRTIDFDEWISNATKQGLPKPDAKKGGELYYWSPEDGHVASFSNDSGHAQFSCSNSAALEIRRRGVRVVKKNPGDAQ